jgi:hypothetical protein
MPYNTPCHTTHHTIHHTIPYNTPYHTTHHTIQHTYKSTHHTIQHTISYNIPYHTIQNTIPYHSTPFHTALPYRPYHLHYHTHHTIPYHTIPYHTIPYHTIPYNITPFLSALTYTPCNTRQHTIPNHAIPNHSISYIQWMDRLPPRLGNIIFYYPRDPSDSWQEVLLSHPQLNFSRRLKENPRYCGWETAEKIMLFYKFKLEKFSWWRFASHACVCVDASISSNWDFPEVVLAYRVKTEWHHNIYMIIISTLCHNSDDMKHSYWRHDKYITQLGWLCRWLSSA